MSKKESYNKMLLDAADSVSINKDTATKFLEEKGIDVSKFVNQGLSEINRKKDENNRKGGNSFFRRVVLAAKITSELYSERTFGHVKLQKLMFLCEELNQMKLSTNYSKQAAGPFDNKFMHSIDKEFMRLNWFNVEVVNNGTYKTYKYQPSQELKKFEGYYTGYFGQIDDKVNWLINTFRKNATKKVELVATIYACLKEIKKEKSIYSFELLCEKFYGWSEEKKKFTKEEIEKALDWLEQNGVIPA